MDQRAPAVHAQLRDLEVTCQVGHGKENVQKLGQFVSRADFGKFIGQVEFIEIGSGVGHGHFSNKGSFLY